MKRRGAMVALPLLLGSVIMLFLVRSYLIERPRANGLQPRIGNLLDIMDSTRSAASALNDAAAAERLYLLTHQPPERDRYVQAMQTWKDESAVIQLLSLAQTFAPTVKKLIAEGSTVAARLDQTMASGFTAGLPAAPALSLDQFNKETAHARR
jgi:hypothetical protein